MFEETRKRANNLSNNVFIAEGNGNESSINRYKFKTTKAQFPTDIPFLSQLVRIQFPLSESYLNISLHLSSFSLRCSNENLFETAPKLSAVGDRDGNLDKLLTELREKNQSMESELKDMQERYSEISLRFAEVEGERQQLVMTVRNLKNAKRN